MTIAVGLASVRTTVREERRANDFVDSRTPGRFLEHGGKYATNRIPLIDVIDRGTDAVKLSPIGGVYRGTGFHAGVDEAQDRKSGED